MKNVLSILFLLIFGSALAQTPQAINYQAVATNNSGVAIANKNIGVRISILSGSANGTSVYYETHTATTTANGIFNVEIGRGNVISGSFPNIQWYAHPHFAKIELDINGGTNYQTIGTTQFLSVPYALFAENVAMIYKVNNDFLYVGDSQRGVFYSNDTIYINEGFGGKFEIGCVAEYLGGEPESLTLNVQGVNNNIYLSNTTLPQVQDIEDCNFLLTNSEDANVELNVSNTTPVGIYPITLTATNPRGRQKSTTKFINILDCATINYENEIVGEYTGSIILSLNEPIPLTIPINDTIDITNPINNDSKITINSSIIGNVVCTKNGVIFTGSFSNRNKVIDLGGIIGRVSLSNISGTLVLTKKVCRNTTSTMYLDVNITSGTINTVDNTLIRDLNIAGRILSGDYVKQ